jgi:hypothetical protein
MDAFVAWIQTTALSQGIVARTWLWPAAETVHFIGLGLVLGIAGLFDLRLMGLFRRASVAAVAALMPFAFAGFAMNLATGLIFLIGHPEQYAHNLAWWLKVVCLALAGLNAFVFEVSAGKEAMTVPAGGDTPRAAKIIGAVSLLSWCGVLFWGRMLPFIGDAF